MGRRAVIVADHAIALGRTAIRTGIGQFFRRRLFLAQQTHQGGGDLVRRAFGDHPLGDDHVLVGDLGFEVRRRQQAILVGLADFVEGRGAGPDGVDAGLVHQPLGLTTARVRNQHDRDALLARPARAARPVQQAGAVHRQFGVDDQTQVRQVQTARGDVGGDADAGATVTQRLKRIGTLALTHFARQADGREAALQQRRLQVTHAVAGRAEDHGTRRLEPAQGVDHRVLDLVGRDAIRAVFDVGVLARLVGRIDADRVLLIAFGQGGDVARDGRREQQGAAFGRCLVQDVLQVLAEAHVQHLVGLIEDGDLQLGQVQIAPINVVLQTAGRSDDDMDAEAEGARFTARIHAADASGDLGAGVGVQPLQFGRDLHGQFPRGRDGQAQGRAAGAEDRLVAQQGRRSGQTKGHGLARARLGRDQQVAIRMLRLQHGGLNRSGFGVALVDQGAVERGMDGGKGHRKPGTTDKGGRRNDRARPRSDLRPGE